MTISRRHMLAAGAAVAAMPALPVGSAFAQQAAPAAPAAPAVQSPGWFRHKIGDITVTAIGDGFVQRPLEGFVRNVSVQDV